MLSTTSLGAKRANTRKTVHGQKAIIRRACVRPQLESNHHHVHSYTILFCMLSNHYINYYQDLLFFAK
jgi:hypothetical protein